MSKVTFLGDSYAPKTYTNTVEDLGDYILNLESPITQSTNGYPGKINLKVDMNFISTTIGHDPVAVCLANNHISDYCTSGLNDTLEALQKNGIKYFGAGELSNKCNNPLIIDVNDISMALLGYVCASTSPVYANDNQAGVLPINVDKIVDDIKSAKQGGAQRIVVSLHWGAEEVYLPKPDDIRIARQLVDNGADLIIGHHAHHIQPYEKYNGKYIFYGLGNLLFPDFKVDSFYDTDTGSCSCQIEKKMKYWNKSSIAVNYDPATNEASYRVLKFDGSKLKATKKIKKCKDISINFNDGYDKRFRRSFVWGKVKNVIFNFLIKPKLPGIRHIKGLISIAKTKSYK